MRQVGLPVKKLVGDKAGFMSVDANLDGKVLTDEETKTQLQIQDKKAFLRALSPDLINISSDSANPSYLTGMVLYHNEGIVLEDALTGTVRNNTGRTIVQAMGTLNPHFIKTGGGVSLIEIVSETSIDDGATWIANVDSRRPVDVTDNGEGYKALPSTIEDWPDQALLRFKLVQSGAGAVTLESTSSTIEGDVYTCPSFVWLLDEK